MGAEKRTRKPAGDQPRGRAAKRSLNLSVRAETHVRFKGLALLMGLDPSELFEVWVGRETAGMRFSLPSRTGDGAASPPGPVGIAAGTDAACA